MAIESPLPVSNVPAGDSDEVTAINSRPAVGVKDPVVKELVVTA